MRFSLRLAAAIVFAAASTAQADAAPIDRAVAALVSQLADHDASEYRGGRRTYPMLGDEDIRVVFFTLEGFGGGNNYTFYIAAFQLLAWTGKPDRYQLLGVDQIGGNGWRSIDADHPRISGECVTLATEDYVPGDPMSHPTVGGTATYCLRLHPYRSTRALEPVEADGSPPPHRKR